MQNITSTVVFQLLLPTLAGIISALIYDKIKSAIEKNKKKSDIYITEKALRYKLTTNQYFILSSVILFVCSLLLFPAYKMLLIVLLIIVASNRIFVIFKIIRTSNKNNKTLPIEQNDKNLTTKKQNVRAWRFRFASMCLLMVLLIALLPISIIASNNLVALSKGNDVQHSDPNPFLPDETDENIESFHFDMNIYVDAFYSSKILHPTNYYSYCAYPQKLEWDYLVNEYDREWRDLFQGSNSSYEKMEDGEKKNRYEDITQKIKNITNDAEDYSNIDFDTCNEIIVLAEEGLILCDDISLLKLLANALLRRGSLYSKFGGEYYNQDKSKMDFAHAMETSKKQLAKMDEFSEKNRNLYGEIMFRIGTIQSRMIELSDDPYDACYFKVLAICSYSISERYLSNISRRADCLYYIGTHCLSLAQDQIDDESKEYFLDLSIEKYAQATSKSSNITNKPDYLGNIDLLQALSNDFDEKWQYYQSIADSD